MVKKITREQLRRIVVSEVARLREHVGPRPGEDPSDFGDDDRFQQMIDTMFDIASDYADHGVTPSDIARALQTAAEEEDQR